MQFTYTPKAKDPVIALKNGGFCINPFKCKTYSKHDKKYERVR